MTVVNWRVKRLLEFLFQMSDGFGLVYDVEEGRVWVKQSKLMRSLVQWHLEFRIVRC